MRPLLGFGLDTGSAEVTSVKPDGTLPVGPAF
jgi:hypothetical protein